jgi:hypothetical protein
MAIVKPPANYKKPCVMCMRIRYFVLAAVVVLVVMWLKPEWRLPPGYNYGAMVGDLFFVIFVVLLGYKIWEYKRDVAVNGNTQEERYAKLRERTDKITAGLDDDPEFGINATPPTTTTTPADNKPNQAGKHINHD